VPEHFHTNRFFRRTDKLKFLPDRNHALLQGIESPVGVIKDVRILHLGYMPLMNRIREKNLSDRNHMEIHNPAFLDQWRDWHYYGTYPVKAFTGEYPKILKKHYGLR